ncbi:hypothetical protein [Haloferax chudinovii]|uniref:Uncharacterized protein n=1 Tax=Haloferax chudinovii TaxID=1109010 RepID=A0ABD5XGZ5_9EURY
MLVNLFVSALKVSIDIARDQQTGREVEQELNTQFAGEEWEITNYDGKEVTLRVESVTVRPKYRPQSYDGGIEQLEFDNIFSSLETERSKATPRERFEAILKDRWITVLQLTIDGGSIEDVRPPGLSLGYVTSTKSIRFDGQVPIDGPVSSIPQMRVAQTHELQSDKLEMKIRFDGSAGEYRRKVADGVDLLQNVQDEVDQYVLRYLLELHHAGKVEDYDHTWPDEDKARKLGSFLAGYPVALDSLAEFMEQINADITVEHECEEQPE